MGLDAINRLERAAFVERLGGIYEHSPWIADAAFERRPFADVEDLHRAMAEAMRAAPAEKKRELIRAHPDLAGRAAIRGALTPASAAEQGGAGLDQCSAEEFARFQEFNDRYNAKFGHPFILAVQGLSRSEILAIFAQRIARDPAAEFATALAEIEQIARLRLAALFGT